MKLLGIFWFPGYSDPSASVVIDGKIICFVEEERLVRNKHANAYFPIRAIDACLKKANLELSDIDAISIGWDCRAHEDGRLLKHFQEIKDKYILSESDIAYQKNRLEKYTTNFFEKEIYRNLNKKYGNISLPRIEFLSHHYAHAVQAYYHSGFKSSLVLVIDGSGEIESTSVWKCEGNQMQKIHQINTPHSLGWFYSAFTEYLGFDAYDGEYKVMGLSCYGKYDKNLSEKLNSIIKYDDNGGFIIDPYFIAFGEKSFSKYFTNKLVDFLGMMPRTECEEISQKHMDLAYAVQKMLEEVILQICEFWSKKTQLNNLAIAGGVGLNVKMNGEIYKSKIFKELFFHPICSDTGMSFSSAMTLEHKRGNKIKNTYLENVYFGNEFSNIEIENVLKQTKVNYEKFESISLEASKLLSEGKVIGWFQGAMEAGPRALGNRSILANPKHIESRDKVNKIVKFREFWRPFCPSMTENAAKKYLDKFFISPYMIVTFDANDIAKKEIPAVVHTDGTCRVQIVTQKSSPLYFELITNFALLTGVEVLLNTSFNIKGEPIVCTPYDAIRTFYATGMDALVMGNFLLTKR